MSMRQRLIPPDLSPAQRAKLKAVRGLMFLIGLNFGCALLMYLFSVIGAPIDWRALAVFAGGQVLYVIMDVGEKYFSARGQMLLSHIFALGREEGIAHAISNPTIVAWTTQEVKEIVTQEEVEEKKLDDLPPSSPSLD